jgi:hypothetical protein
MLVHNTDLKVALEEFSVRVMNLFPVSIIPLIFKDQINLNFWAQQLPVVHGLLIHEVSTSHTTRHNRR